MKIRTGKPKPLNLPPGLFIADSAAAGDTLWVFAHDIFH
jgi:hypothetical protein